MTQCTNPRCTHEVEDIRYHWCDSCRRNKRVWNHEYLKLNQEAGIILCSRCRVLKEDDGFKICHSCREKRRTFDAKRKGHLGLKIPLKPRVTPYGVNLKNAYVDRIDEKAAEKGVSRNELFSELIDQCLSRVVVWS